MSGTPPMRTARLLSLAADAVAVLVILDTLVRLGRRPARSAEAAAERLRTDPALRRYAVSLPPSASGRVARSRPPARPGA